MPRATQAASRVVAACIASCAPMIVAAAAAATDPSTVIEGTTAQGDRVRLFPNGRWEFVDARKADAQRPAIEAADRERSLEQGGILGIGRKVKPGDPDYNRGSIGGKSR